jgi:enterochelin esterase-like enzyme
MRPHARILAAAILCLLAPLAAVAQESPRIAALREREAAGDWAALSRFWSEVDKQGTPLVESINQENVLVTFLWRGGDKTKGVVVLGSVANKAPMERIAGTDVWFRSVVVRRDARFTYRLAPNADPKADAFPSARWDPRNRKPFPKSDPLLSLAEMPDAPSQTWVAKRPDVAAGKLTVEEPIRSKALGGKREMRVYTPAGYSAEAEPYRLLIVPDGLAYTTLIPLPVILDNLIAAGEIPPVVAVLIDRLDSANRDSDLSCNKAYARFLAEEVLPWVRQKYRVTADPAGTVLAGSSRGGLAAACAAIEHPELFGNVLSQSGSFVWPEKEPEPEWVRRHLEASLKLPLRFYLDVGLLEVWPTNDGKGASLLDANRRLRDVLQSKGYVVRYAEYSGGHGHANWQGTISEGLKALLGKPREGGSVPPPSAGLPARNGNPGP